MCDYATFDNIIFSNEFAKSFNVINKLFFNYDVQFNNLTYEYSTIDLTINVEEKDGKLLSTVSVVLVNNFNEKVIYKIKIAK